MIEVATRDENVSRAASVAFVPFDSANPYQPELADHLRLLGITVETGLSLKELASRILQGGGGPRVVHLHWLPRVRLSLGGCLRAMLFLLRIAFIRATGRKIVWTVHNLYSHEAVTRRLERWVTTCLTLMVTRIVVHSPTAVRLVAREFRLRAQERIVVIPHGNYIGSYENVVSGNVARARLGLNEESFVYLFFGNIRPYKGVRQLIDTFRHMDAPSSVLLLAGRVVDDAALAELEQAIAGDPRIRIHTGFIEDRNVQLYMNASDVVVFPYLDVLTSGAVILAMSFGRPCVATETGCIPDVLDEAGAFLYQAGTSNSLRSALEKAYASRDRLAEMGAGNLERARAWGWNRVARETADVYGQALGSRNAGRIRPSPMTLHD